jgi:hypothetical protein
MQNNPNMENYPHQALDLLLWLLHNPPGNLNDENTAIYEGVRSKGKLVIAELTQLLWAYHVQGDNAKTPNRLLVEQGLQSHLNQLLSEIARAGQRY